MTQDNLPATATVAELPARPESLDALLGAKASTRRERRKDLGRFAEWLGLPCAEAAARRLLESGPVAARETVLRYRATLVDTGLSAGTVNRRLSTLRAVVALARNLGYVAWGLEGVRGVKAQGYRDTAGPGLAGVRAMYGVLEARDDAKGARDRAVLACLFDLGLRRGELAGLDLEHFDREGGRLWILGKGRLDRETLTLPGPTREALEGWLGHRRTAPGPLFLSITRHGQITGRRLAASSVYYLVRETGAAVGLCTRPHGLRHAGITHVLDATGGDLRSAQRFSRHAKAETLSAYDDNRRDDAGRLAALLAAARVA